MIARIQPLRDDWSKLSEAVTKGMEFAVQNGKQHRQRTCHRRAADCLHGGNGRIDDIKARPDLSIEDRTQINVIELKMVRLRGEIYREIVITDDALLAKIAGEFKETLRVLERDSPSSPRLSREPC